MKKNTLNFPSRVVYENYVGKEDDLENTIDFVLKAFRIYTEYRQRIVDQIRSDYNGAISDLRGNYGKYVVAKILRLTHVQFEEIADAILEHEAVRKALEEEKKESDDTD